MLKLFGLLLPVGVLFSAAAHAGPITFTGDVPTDFFGSDVVGIVDPGGIDVALPAGFPAGTLSGHDLAGIRFALDSTTDTLFVGIDTYGIAGDADGNGDPSGTGAILAGLGGADTADFGGTESFAVMFDIDEDGTFDVIAGVSATSDLSAFGVAVFSGSPFTPGFAFGAALAGNTGAVFASPSAAAPDVEFTILNYSTLPLSSGFDAAPSFAAAAFMGSLSDAGIGEDFLPAVGATISFTPVPEPGALILVSAVGVAALKSRRASGPGGRRQAMRSQNMARA